MILSALSTATLLGDVNSPSPSPSPKEPKFERKLPAESDTAEEILTLQGHTGGIETVAFTPDGFVQIEDYRIDFNQLVGEKPRYMLAYAVCYIQSEAERRDLTLHVGSDDQARVYLNGDDQNAGVESTALGEHHEHLVVVLYDRARRQDVAATEASDATEFQLRFALKNSMVRWDRSSGGPASSAASRTPDSSWNARIMIPTICVFSRNRRFYQPPAATNSETTGSIQVGFIHRRWRCFQR